MLCKLVLLYALYVANSTAHSASSSSALATSSLKFKNPRLEKDKPIIGRKNKISVDDDDDDDASKSDGLFSCARSLSPLLHRNERPRSACRWKIH